MPHVPIIMPQLGESISEASVVRFAVQPGDQVNADQEVIEVETHKAVMGVTTPCAGTLASFSVEIGSTYAVGAVLGFVEASVEEAAKLGFLDQSPVAVSPTITAQTRQAVEPVESAASTPVSFSSVGPFISPRVRARMDALGWRPEELMAIPGSGSAGRVTANDLERYLQELENLPTKRASTLRQVIAEAMRRSWSRPLATIGVGLVLGPILEHRRNLTPAPGPALYVSKALALALAENPQLAARLVGDNLVLPSSIDIGIAVEVEDGVIVPVLRQLDKTPFETLGAKYQEMVAAARSRRLSEDLQTGAIASVTNYGTLGITWGTPIPQPHETLIVGLGRGEQRPYWDEAKGAFLPQMTAELTITLDHRVIDGGAAGRLIQRLVSLLAEPEKL
ncbi:MAG: 2-oxo acid dehydrogenase subunit E2 [Verrucomicrobia bacterium]|nr:2-oxo acid dehydrogenase subunit E2 [Verrucomicrobiota bacterium]